MLEEQRNWQNRPLQHFYPFVFVDCLYVNVRRKYENKDCAVYTILAYDINGVKDILGLWIQESESKHFWAQIFDEIKSFPSAVRKIMYTTNAIEAVNSGFRKVTKRGAFPRVCW